jgi:hypothetical protein
MIKEAAILKDGIVYTGHRHNNILCDKSRPFAFLRDGIQGFVTDTGIFMNRKDAANHAFECGQTKENKNITRPSTGLLSEDLY